MSQAICPKCGALTNQSPCWRCGYRFPLAIKDFLDDLEEYKLKEVCPECGEHLTFYRSLENKTAWVECQKCGFTQERTLTKSEEQISISDVLAKVARQIRGDLLDARIYLDKFGFENLDLTKEEKRFLKKYFGLQTR